jgi:phosphoglycolate phosphatase
MSMSAFRTSQDGAFWISEEADHCAFPLDVPISRHLRYRSTLADQLSLVFAQLERCRRSLRFSRSADEDVQFLRHAGCREISRLTVPLWKLPGSAWHMRRLKTEHLADVPLFPGTGDDAARARRWRRPPRPRQVSLGAADYATLIRPTASLFGKATKFRRIAKRAGVRPSQAISIGDEVRDIEAARAAGIAAAPWRGAIAAPGAEAEPGVREKDIAVLLVNNAPA